jgi:hypothetical protein
MSARELYDVYLRGCACVRVREPCHDGGKYQDIYIQEAQENKMHKTSSNIVETAIVQIYSDRGVTSASYHQITALRAMIRDSKAP